MIISVIINCLIVITGVFVSMLYSLLMDRNDAEDVVQELFLNLWKNRGRNRDKGKCIRIFISDG